MAESLPVGTIEVGALDVVDSAAVGTDVDVVLASTLVDDGWVTMAAVEDSLVEVEDSIVEE